MTQQNGWSNPSAQGKQEAFEMAEFLEERASFPDQMLVDQTLLETLAPLPGERLLEAGCGSGVLCRQMARFVAPEGTITGIDISGEMIAAARANAKNEGLDGVLNFEISSGEQMPYPEGYFDAAFAARLLLHVPEPARVAAEMVRVIRPGGRVALMDWDFDTVAVDHPDRDLTRRLLHWRADHYGGNNWSGRALLRYAHHAGLEGLRVVPAVIVARDERDGFTQSLWRAAQRACQGGAITTSEHDEWVGFLKEQIKKGVFFASIVNFIVIGWKPQT
jgi:ubiquinone/menaquinone biosynthesis C-methylase UbiE